MRRVLAHSDWYETVSSAYSVSECGECLCAPDSQRGAGWTADILSRHGAVLFQGNQTEVGRQEIYCTVRSPNAPGHAIYSKLVLSLFNPLQYLTLQAARSAISKKHVQATSRPNDQHLLSHARRRREHQDLLEHLSHQPHHQEPTGRSGDIDGLSGSRHVRQCTLTAECIAADKQQIRARDQRNLHAHHN